MSSAWLTQECGSADNAAPRTTADVHDGVARGDRPADQFQRPAPHRRGEAISHLAFRAGIQERHPHEVVERIADAMSDTLASAHTDERIPRGLLEQMQAQWEAGM